MRPQLGAAVAVSALLVLTAVSGASGDATSSPLPTPIVSGGQVNAVTVSGHTAYLGGSFRYVGGAGVGSFIALNSASGTLAASSPRVNAISIEAMADDGAGGWYLGGTIAINGAWGIRVVHILADGALDANWKVSLESDPYALLLSGNVLYVAGNFRSVNTPNGSFPAIIWRR